LSTLGTGKYLTMTNFTTDWFSYAIPNFQAITQFLGPVPRVLEIGVFQGRSTCWILENMLADNGTMISVDPFIDDEIDAFDSESVTASPHYNQERLDLWRANTQEVIRPGQTLDLRLGRSYRELARLITENQSFDFIYVDGNHAAAAVLSDACACFGMLRIGGIMLFDDYLWDHTPNWLARPKMSIDSFVNMFQPLGRQIISNYQLAIQRIR
jgi:predicted O-methyltransferase YrrM